MVRIVALTDAGQCLGLKLKVILAEKLGLEADLWYKPQPFGERLREAFSAGDTLLCICASGIVVRTLAPVIQDKHSDPAVLVLDELGRYVIPLLSGHEGGANDLAHAVAGLLKAECVLTTAKAYLKPVYTVGMGCERDCPSSFLREIFDQCLSDAGIDISQVRSINSIDLKADEVGLMALAKALDKPFRCYNTDELATVEAQLSERSDYVFETVGVYGVAESAALVAASEVTGSAAELVVTKKKNAKATCSIARSFQI